jgi:hypothetical protein
VIKPVCDVCKKELQGFGAILLSPPGTDSSVKKFHICMECYKVMKNHYRLKD